MHWHLGVGRWLHPAPWGSVMWWEASWKCSWPKQSPLVLWVRVSCRRPINKGMTLREVSFRREPAWRWPWHWAGLTPAIGSCKGIIGENIDWVFPIVYKECYSKVRRVGRLFQTSARSKRAYIRARVCSGGCDYCIGLAYDGPVIDLQ